MQNKGQNKQWYVLYVNVRHEKKVYDKFVEQNIESYLPIVKTLKQWSDRKKIVEEPLFTGYVFVKLEAHELDKPIYITGVVNFLSFGRQKAIVQQSEIDALQYLVEKGYSLNSNVNNIQIGSKVKLTLAAFKEEIAIVNNIKDNTATLYFESLNQYIKVTAPISALEVIR